LGDVGKQSERGERKGTEGAMREGNQMPGWDWAVVRLKLWPVRRVIKTHILNPVLAEPIT